MSTTDGGANHLRRRAWAAVYKYKQFIQTLDRVSEASFPHEDGEQALQYIREFFVVEEQELKEKIESIGDFNSALIRQLLPKSRRLIGTYTKALGLILRSTNVRNNFEIYHALKKLSKSAVGEDTRLVVSSEWSFVPFTLAMNLKALPNFIFVGVPASEANNLLVTPLAGHEIGHSVWKKIENSDGLVRKITEIAMGYAKENLEGLEFQSTAELEESETDLMDQLIDKVEEIFCDFVGLYIFGSAYIYSFEYYLAPGNPRSMERYPSDRLRMDAIRSYADDLKISYEEDLFEDWKSPVEFSETPLKNYWVTDRMLSACLDDLKEACTHHLQSKKVELPSAKKIGTIQSSIERGEPFEDKAKFSEVVNALWLVAAKKRIWEHEEMDQLLFANEIALKTVEVIEYQSRLRDAKKDA